LLHSLSESVGLSVEPGLAAPRWGEPAGCAVWPVHLAVAWEACLRRARRGAGLADEGPGGRGGLTGEALGDWLANDDRRLRRAWPQVARVAELGERPLRRWLLGEPWVLVRVHGHAKVLAGGHGDVLAGGLVEVLTSR
jgi:hypothetical protein